MIDMVPKAVMLNLVSRAKEGLQGELLAELYKADVLDDLLQESEFTQQRRKECKKMIEVGDCFYFLLLSVSLLTFISYAGFAKSGRDCWISVVDQETTRINTPTLKTPSSCAIISCVAQHARTPQLCGTSSGTSHNDAIYPSTFDPPTFFLSLHPFLPPTIF